MKSFWHDLPRPFFILAPMEAVTDVVFRHVVAKAAAPDVFFTEFTNATGWHHAGEKAIGGRLIKTGDEKPIVAQLWGSDPTAMSALARQCKEWGYDGIDINMGCPDASAIKGGGGAQMIRTPDVAASMIAAAKESELPVTVKTRLGYTYVEEWREWLTFILKQDVEVLTIHLRTKKEMSKVPAHFELIPEIKALRDEVAPNTLLVINGDIEDRAHGERLVAETGVDGVMIGRGIFHNPFAFAREHLPAQSEGRSAGVAEASRPEDETAKSELIQLLRYHLDLYDKYSEQTKRPFETLKRFFKIYIRDFDDASQLRDTLMHTKSTSEVRAVLDALESV